MGSLGGERPSELAGRVLAWLRSGHFLPAAPAHTGWGASCHCFQGGSARSPAPQEEESFRLGPDHSSADTHFPSPSACGPVTCGSLLTPAPSLSPPFPGLSSLTRGTGWTHLLFTCSGPPRTLEMNLGPSGSPSSSQEPPGAHSPGWLRGSGGTCLPRSRPYFCPSGESCMPLASSLVPARVPHWGLPKAFSWHWGMAVFAGPGGGGAAGGRVEAVRALGSGMFLKVDAKGIVETPSGLVGT